MSVKDGRSNNSIVLGSGYLYIAEYTGELPEDLRSFEKPENLIGFIQGGCSIEYSAEFYTAKDDMGRAQKSIMTDEAVKLKSGIMTWNGKTLEKLVTTARVTEKDGIRTVKIGGVGNQNGKNYVIHFFHADPEDGDIGVTIVGKNEGGFTLAFTKDKETVIDAEFNALPCDDEGTLIIFKEYAPGGADVPHTLIVAAVGGGSISTGAGGEYNAGIEINLIAAPNAGYEFNGWTTSAGGTFTDPNSETTTFTMPGNDTTIIVNYKETP